MKTTIQKLRGGSFESLTHFKKVATQFYWPSMQKYVQDYVKSCDICQRTKSETLPPAGLLQPLSIPYQVWDDITIDFVAGLPLSHGKDSIFMVVDRLSKYAHFMSLSHLVTTKSMADKFVQGVVKLHGMPKSIMSDRDPIFISKFWQEFFTMFGTMKMSSAYHP